MRVIFNSSTHTYECEGERYESVSGASAKFFHTDDWDFIAERSTAKRYFKSEYNKLLRLGGGGRVAVAKLKKLHGEDFNIKLSMLKRSWDSGKGVAIDIGNEVHLIKEEEVINRGFDINPFDRLVYEHIKSVQEGFDNISRYDNLFHLEDGVHTELLIHNHIYKIAGQADKVYIKTLENGDRLVYIDDYKTDKSIIIDPTYRDTSGNMPMMKPPLCHLYSTNYYKYTIKISIYAKMLEMYGFTVAGIRITHLHKTEDGKITGEETPYILSYKPWEAEYIIKNHQTV